MKFAMKKEKLIQFILFSLLLYWKAHFLFLENRQFAIPLKLLQNSFIILIFFPPSSPTKNSLAVFLPV